MRKFSLPLLILILVLSLSLTACSQPPAELQTSTPLPSKTPGNLPTTQVFVDGLGDDWGSYPWTGQDPAGDQLDKSPDLAGVKAFRNDRYLYLLVDLHQPGEFDHMIFHLETEDGARHQVNVWPNDRGQINREMSGVFENIPVQADLDQVYEIKLDLQRLGGPAVRLHTLEVYLGYTDQRGDILQGGSIFAAAEQEGNGRPSTASAAELEPTAPPQKTPTGKPEPTPEQTRPPHYTIQDSPGPGEFLFRSPLQIPLVGDLGPDGLLYISDWTGRQIVRMDRNGQVVDNLGLWKDGETWHGRAPVGVQFSPDGVLYLHDYANIYRWTAEEGLETVVHTPLASNQMAFDSSGNLYFGFLGENGEKELRRLTPEGQVETAVEDLGYVHGLAIGPDGKLYLGINQTLEVLQMDLETGQIKPFFQAQSSMPDPIYLTFDSEGNLWVKSSFYLARVGPGGEMLPTWLDGRPVEGENHSLFETTGDLIIHEDGTIYTFNYIGQVIRYDPDPETPDYWIRRRIYEGMHGTAAAAANGVVYVFNNLTHQLLRTAPGEEPKILQTIEYSFDIHTPLSMVIDSQGGLHIAMPDGRIARMTDSGALEEYAELLCRYLEITPEDEIYCGQLFPDQGGHLIRLDPSTGDQARVPLNLPPGESLDNQPLEIAAAPDGGLYILANDTVYKMKPDGSAGVYARLESDHPGMPKILAAGPDGTVYLQEHRPDYPWYPLYRIREGGGKDLLAYGFFGDPTDLAVTPDGSGIVIVESGAVILLPLP